jgi:type II secretory pathway component PulF
MRDRCIDRAVVAALFLVNVMPQFEELLWRIGSELPDRWMSAVRASRFALTWWWAVALAAIGGAVTVLYWTRMVAVGRLFVALVLIDTAESITPPTRPDSGPASTSPPTA